VVVPERLTAAAVRAYRELELAAQGGLCALCGEPIETGKAVLDHDHKTGLIRGVLHRGCNALEGTITNALPRNLITPKRLTAIFANWDQYHAQPKDVLHPSHRTADERKVRARKRARKKK
jgi:hypothetical protein